MVGLVPYLFGIFTQIPVGLYIAKKDSSLLILLQAMGNKAPM